VARAKGPYGVDHLGIFRGKVEVFLK